MTKKCKIKVKTIKHNENIIIKEICIKCSITINDNLKIIYN